jgi:predicted metal-dependent phosphoesterase TrpH
MPRASRYTSVARDLAALARPARADLHTHSTASDGDFTPSQVVARARAAGLCAVSLTDHDTFAGLDEARAAATGIELVPGVEISTAFAGRELHLLGYFVRTDDAALNAALARVRAGRRARFRELLDALRARGLELPEDRAALVEAATDSIGRRHAAGLLVACGHARTRAEAMYRFVNPALARGAGKVLVPIAEAVALVRNAGGVTSLAHPPAELTDEQFAELRAAGLGALEVAYPWGRSSPAARRREVAARVGFALSGGSDCHGPDPAHRAIGSHGITVAELEALRERAGRAGF